MDQKELWTFLDHHLSGGHLLAVAIFAIELIVLIQKLFGAKLFETIAQRRVPFDIN